MPEPVTALPLSPLLATCAVFLTGAPSGHGADQLLTGDKNNNLHQHDSNILDLSADGDLVLFASGPPVTGSTPGITKGGFYIRSRSANTLKFVSDPAIPASGDASFSDNGRYHTWRGIDDFIYWRDSDSNITRLITPAADGASRRPVMSADGRYVAYASIARNIVSNKAGLQADSRAGVYLYDSVTKTTRVVSLTSSGKALDTGVGSVSSGASIGTEFDFSADGKYVVFSSDATNVHPDRPADYPSGFLCVYRRNLATGVVNLLNMDKDGNLSRANFSGPRVSANGSRVAFLGGFLGLFAAGQMIEGMKNGFGTDIYVKEMPSAKVWLASKTTDSSNSDGVYAPTIAISGNGATVIFGSSSTKFVTEDTDPTPGNDGVMDIFRADLNQSASAKLTLVTKSPNASGNVIPFGDGLIPGNGEYVAFCTSQVEAMTGTGSGDNFYYHGFSVSGPKALGPEIVVEQPKGSSLTDGTTKKSFGTVEKGASSTAKTFVIKNIGSAKLTGMAISKSGSDKDEFVVTALEKDSLAPGSSTKFKITFKPSAVGTRKATVKISSNDSNENPFDYSLTGLGVAP